uniref:NADH dehydrogenase subunit 2 n=1 Tax=Hemiarma marina TaxID=1848298 RepID=A0A679ELG2_9CRYP|nr:NADH dehydrogenase subunit 2 [Hemiarma marina]
MTFGSSWAELGVPGVEWFALVPEIFGWVSVQIFVVLGVWWGTNEPKPVLSGVMVRWMILLLAALGGLALTSPFGYVSLFEGAWSWTPGIRGLQLVVVGLAIIALALGTSYLRQERLNAFEWSLLMAVAAFGLMGMISSEHFLGFYLMLELQSFCFYILAAAGRTSAFSTEAALKYFILGAIASGFFLFGAALCYGVTGTLFWTEMASVSPYFHTNFFEALVQAMAGQGMDFSVLMETFSTEAALSATGAEALGYSVGCLFVWFGVLFKLSAFPFHVWTPDVYEGAPTPVTAYFALVPKLAAFIVLVKWTVGPFFGQAEVWGPLLFVSAAGSLLVGAFGAMAQRNLKRLLAYSTIGHMGFILMGLASGSWEGLGASVFYLWVYSVMSMGTFALLLGMAKHRKSDPRASLLEDPTALSIHPTVSSAWLEGKRPGRAWTFAASRFYADRAMAPNPSDKASPLGGMSGPNRDTYFLPSATGKDPIPVTPNLNPLEERKLLSDRLWAFWGVYGQAQRYTTIQDLGAIAKRNAAIGAAWMLLFFSMAGVPPLAGFWSKYQVFLSALGSGWVPLALIAVGTSVLSAFYYLRVIKTVYFPSAAKTETLTAPFDWAMDRTATRILGVSLLIVSLLVFDSSTWMVAASYCLPNYFF